MSLPQAEIFPDDPQSMPPARKRRARRLLAPMDADERAGFLAQVAHRASPSFDFFLFSILSGVIFCAGIVLNLPALLVLAAIVAPMMAPVVGLALGTVIGSGRFFLRSMVGLLIGGGLVFGIGYLGGALTAYWQPVNLEQAYLNAQISWSNFVVLAVGAIFTAAAMTRSEHSAAVPSVALAYQLYLPLSIAGFGLGSGFQHLFPDGLVIFALHLAWSALLGALTLAILGLRPLTMLGYTFGGTVALVGIILLIGLGGAGAVVGGQIALPTPIPSATPTVTLTPTPTLTPVPPTETPTPSLTPTITDTPAPPTETPTPSPTPVYAIISTNDGKGAVLRDEPGGVVIRSYFEGTRLQVLPGIITLNGITWVRVIGPDGANGWIVQRLLVTATPAPNW